MKSYAGKCLSQFLGLTSLTSLGILLMIAAARTNAWMDRFGGVDRAIAATALSETQDETTHTLVAQTKLDIVDTALAHGSLNTMIALMEALDLAEDLRGFGPFMVFAPTDDAFAAVPTELMEDLQTDRELMAKVLAYHVVRVRTPISTDEITGTRALRTLERSLIEIKRQDGGILVNDASVIDADIKAANGIIHTIDAVLIPPDVMAELR